MLNFPFLVTFLFFYLQFHLYLAGFPADVTTLHPGTVPGSTLGEIL